MNENELKAELDGALNAEYSEHISDNLLFALRSCVKEIPPRTLGIPTSEYCIILDVDKDNFNYHQTSILLNSFHGFPFAHFEKLGFTLANYQDFYNEITVLVGKWTEYVQPFRKVFNQKMEVLKKTGGGKIITGPGFGK